MHQVAAVAALGTRDQVHEGHRQRLARIPHAHRSATPKLLNVPDEEKRTQRGANHRRQAIDEGEYPTGGRVVDIVTRYIGRVAHCAAERRMRHHHGKRPHARPKQHAAHVLARRLAPSEQRTDAGQAQENEAQRDHPLVVVAGTDGDRLVAQGLADQRKGRRDQDEEQHPHQDPVVEQEHEVTAEKRVDPVLSPQQWQALDDHERAEGKQPDHVPDEIDADARARERVHRRDHPGTRQEGSENRHKEGQAEQEHIPDLEHAPALLKHDRVQEGRAAHQR